MNKENKGITLIALVITIVVLVILVGVSVSVAINTGLVANSKEAVQDYGKAQKQEELDIDRIAGVLEIQSMEEVKAGKYAGTSNKKYVSGGKTAYIPAGFTVSNVAGESSIDDGLVIYSNKSNNSSITDTAEQYMAKIKNGTEGYTVETLQSTYNQYVWIPVENPSEMYGITSEGNKVGKLYDFGNATDGFATSPDQATALNWTETENGVISWNMESWNKEPSYISDEEFGDDSELNVDKDGNIIITKDGIQKSFDKMIKSIETYNGFYIGRYEVTGTVDNPTVVKGVKPLASDSEYEVLEVLGWYGLYTMCEIIEKDNEVANGKVHTSMIWGSQWDQAIKKSLVDKDDFLTEAETYGVCNTTEVANSGTKTSAYNIYDMSGNVEDWTMESGVGGTRSHRGGNFGDQLLTQYQASFRGSAYSPWWAIPELGARVQLYL